MRDNGRKAAGRDLTDIERDLERLAPVAAPAGLRDRVMDRTAQARNSAALSPRMRILAAACSVVIIAVLMIDPLIGRHEAARIAALLDGQSSARVATEEAARLAEALGGQGIEAGGIVRLVVMAAAAAREDRGRDFFEARARLKGWLNNETSENLN